MILLFKSVIAVFLSSELSTMVINVLTLSNCTFAFICTKAWDGMDDMTVNRDVQFYSNYQKEVDYSKTDKELVSHVRLNRCFPLLKRTNREHYCI